MKKFYISIIAIFLISSSFSLQVVSTDAITVSRTSILRNDQFTLTIDVIGYGNITKFPNLTVYDNGTNVTLKPQPHPGWLFDDWSGSHSFDLTHNGDNTWNITMNADKHLIATFVENSWIKRYYISRNDIGYDVQKTVDGGYIITGYRYAYGVTSHPDLWLMKIDANGSNHGSLGGWQMTFDGDENHDYGYDVEQTEDKGFIVVGTTKLEKQFGENPVFDQDLWVIRTYPDGSMNWSKSIGGIDFIEAGLSIEQTVDDGFIIAGWNESRITSNRDLFVIKLNKTGALQWKQNYGGKYKEVGEDIIELDDNNGYVIIGLTESYGAGGSDFWLIKIDTDGVEQWNRTFGRSGDDKARSLDITEDGGFVLTGTIIQEQDGNHDTWLIETDSEGNENWNKTFGGTQTDEGYSVRQTSDGEYIISGYTYSFGDGWADAWIIKTHKSGKERWNQTFGDDKNDAGFAIDVAEDGYIIVGQYTPSSPGSYGLECYVIKIAPELPHENQPPILEDIPDYTASPDETISIELDSFVEDPESNDFDLTWIVSGNQQITVTITEDRIAQLKIPANWTGNETLTFSVTDPNGLSATDETVITAAYGPILEISEIRGGLFYIHGKFKNIGDQDAIGVNWNLKLSGSKISFGGNTQDYIEVIHPGEEITIKSSPIWGFGTPQVTLNITHPSHQFQESVKRDAIVVLFFIRIRSTTSEQQGFTFLKSEVNT